eukprot:25776_1
MTALVSEQRVRNTSNMFKIGNRKCYVNWDKFCVSSLNSAKEEIHKKRVFRYKSIADAKAEEGRIRQVTEGIEDIAEFIEDQWMEDICRGGFGICSGCWWWSSPGSHWIEQIYECDIMVNDLSLPIKPICLCGAVLVPTLNDECYVDEYSYVICDICDQRITNQKDVYHCPQRRVEPHPHGYDICIKCAREHNTKFKRYHAVIIQSLPENGAHIACKDATALESLFTSLNYHEVVVIRSQNANKRTIKCALRRMSLNKRNDVVVICYTGHGERYRNNRWKCLLENQETITDQELVESVKFGHNDNASFGDTCDIVIKLNACDSGRFGAQQNHGNRRQVDDEKMPQYLVDYDNLGRNMITIAARASDENANFLDKFHRFINW